MESGVLLGFQENQEHKACLVMWAEMEVWVLRVRPEHEAALVQLVYLDQSVVQEIKGQLEDLDNRVWLDFLVLLESQV